MNYEKNMAEMRMILLLWNYMILKSWWVMNYDKSVAETRMILNTEEVVINMVNVGHLKSFQALNCQNMMVS